MPYKRPPALEPGDGVAVIAPAGVPESADLEAGLALLGERYEVVTYRGMTKARFGIHAGRDEVRRDELERALTDPAIRCVIAARGGYGTSRALPQRAVDGLRDRPRLIVGFSDLTVLLSATLRRAGLRAIHGPMACQLGRRGERAFAPLRRLLEDAAPPPAVDGLDGVGVGLARGPLIGGNLTMLSHLIGTPWMPRLDGAVLFIEDVGERPYRLDRCLIHLRHAGLLDGVAGVVVGDLTACDAERGEGPARPIIEDFCAALGRPCCLGLPAGHGPENLPLPLGAPVELDADQGRLTFLEGVVRGG